MTGRWGEASFPPTKHSRTPIAGLTRICSMRRNESPRSQGVAPGIAEALARGGKAPRRPASRSVRATNELSGASRSPAAMTGRRPSQRKIAGTSSSCSGCGRAARIASTRAAVCGPMVVAHSMSGMATTRRARDGTWACGRDRWCVARRLSWRCAATRWPRWKISTVVASRASTSSCRSWWGTE